MRQFADGTARGGRVRDNKDAGHSQYDGNGGSGFTGHPAVLIPQAAAGVESAEYRNGQVIIRAAGQEWTLAHNLLEA